MYIDSFANMMIVNQTPNKEYSNLKWFPLLYSNRLKSYKRRCLFYEAS